MPFRQIHSLTSAKLMIFIGYQIIIPLFFLFLPRKTPKIASSLPPFLLASSLACLLPSPVPGSFLPGSS